jgi:hypothetical protein
MAGQRDEKGGRDKPQEAEAEADARRARLAQELRANLLKRKAQSRVRKGPPTPPKEGGQGRG